MNTNNSYIINKEFVVNELMDNELTVINLQKGFYFIGRDSAIDIFLMLEQAMTLDAMVEKTLATYDVDEQTARNAIVELIEQWLAEELIVQTDIPADITPGDTSSENKKAWTQPVFVAFDDMRDLLLLDPIHDTELDQQGWPVAAENTTNDK